MVDRIIYHQVKRGKGAALRTGFAAVTGSRGERRAASAGKTGIVSIVDLLVLCHDRAGEVRTNL